MLQFYFLSILLNLIAGLIFIYAVKNEEGTGMVVKSETKYDTGAEWLAARTITIGKTYASTDTGIMDWVDVKNELKAKA